MQGPEFDEHRDLSEEAEFKKGVKARAKERKRTKILYPTNERGTRADILIAPCKICGRRGVVRREDRICTCEHNHIADKNCRLPYCERVKKKKEANAN